MKKWLETFFILLFFFVLFSNIWKDIFICHIVYMYLHNFFAEGRMWHKVNFQGSKASLNS